MGDDFTRRMADAKVRSHILNNLPSADDGGWAAADIKGSGSLDAHFNHAFWLNDLLFVVPPQQISVDTDYTVFQWKALRSSSSVKVPSGQSSIYIKVDLVVPSNNSILNVNYNRSDRTGTRGGLIDLILQFKYTPFCYIENAVIRSAVQVHIDRAMAAKLHQMSVTTIPDQPHSLHVELLFGLFNYMPYSLDFSYKDVWESIGTNDVEKRTLRQAMDLEAPPEAEIQVPSSDADGEAGEEGADDSSDNQGEPEPWSNEAPTASFIPHGYTRGYEDLADHDEGLMVEPHAVRGPAHSDVYCAYIDWLREVWNSAGYDYGALHQVGELEHNIGDTIVLTWNEYVKRDMPDNVFQAVKATLLEVLQERIPSQTTQQRRHSGATDRDEELVTGAPTSSNPQFTNIVIHTTDGWSSLHKQRGADPGVDEDPVRTREEAANNLLRSWQDKGAITVEEVLDWHAQQSAAGESNIDDEGNLMIAQGSRGRGYTPATEEEEESSGRSNRVSTHFVIFADGTIVQLYPLSEITWHAGTINSESVGIDLDSQKNTERDGVRYPTDAQLESLITLVNTTELYPYTITGHRHNRPGKSCPAETHLMSGYQNEGVDHDFDRTSSDWSSRIFDEPALLGRVPTLEARRGYNDNGNLDRDDLPALHETWSNYRGGRSGPAGSISSLPQLIDHSQAMMDYYNNQETVPREEWEQLWAEDPRWAPNWTPPAPTPEEAEDETSRGNQKAGGSSKNSSKQIPDAETPDSSGDTGTTDEQVIEILTRCPEYTEWVLDQQDAGYAHYKGDVAILDIFYVRRKLTLRASNKPITTNSPFDDLIKGAGQSYPICTSISAQMVNLFAEIPLNGHTVPTAQFLGGLDTRYNLTIMCNGLAEVQNIQHMKHMLHSQSINFRNIPDSWIVRIDNPLINAFGHRHAAITTDSVDTVPGSPGSYHIELALLGHKPFQVAQGFTYMSSVDASEVLAAFYKDISDLELLEGLDNRGYLETPPALTALETDMVGQPLFQEVMEAVERTRAVIHNINFSMPTYIEDQWSNIHNANFLGLGVHVLGEDSPIVRAAEGYDESIVMGMTLSNYLGKPILHGETNNPDQYRGHPGTGLHYSRTTYGGDDSPVFTPAERSMVTSFRVPSVLHGSVIVHGYPSYGEYTATSGAASGERYLSVEMSTANFGNSTVISPQVLGDSGAGGAADHQSQWRENPASWAVHHLAYEAMVSLNIAFLSNGSDYIEPAEEVIDSERTSSRTGYGRDENYGFEYDGVFGLTPFKANYRYNYRFNDLLDDEATWEELFQVSDPMYQLAYARFWDQADSNLGSMPQMLAHNSGEVGTVTRMSTVEVHGARRYLSQIWLSDDGKSLTDNWDARLAHLQNNPSGSIGWAWQEEATRYDPDPRFSDEVNEARAAGMVTWLQDADLENRGWRQELFLGERTWATLEQIHERDDAAWQPMIRAVEDYLYNNVFLPSLAAAANPLDLTNTSLTAAMREWATLMRGNQPLLPELQRVFATAQLAPGITAYPDLLLPPHPLWDRDLDIRMGGSTNTQPDFYFYNWGFEGQYENIEDPNGRTSAWLHDMHDVLGFDSVDAPYLRTVSAAGENTDTTTRMISSWYSDSSNITVSGTADGATPIFPIVGSGGLQEANTVLDNAIKENTGRELTAGLTTHADASQPLRHNPWFLDISTPLSEAKDENHQLRIRQREERNRPNTNSANFDWRTMVPIFGRNANMSALPPSRADRGGSVLVGQVYEGFYPPDTNVIDLDNSHRGNRERTRSSTTHPSISLPSHGSHGMSESSLPPSGGASNSDTAAIETFVESLEETDGDGEILDYAFTSRGLYHLAYEGMKDMDRRKFCMRRAFPTFKVMFVEEDAVNRSWRALDDFYSYGQIESIRIVRSRKNPVDAAVIEFINVSGILTGNDGNTRAARAMGINADPSSDPEHIAPGETNDPHVQDTEYEQSMSGFQLEEGTNIIVKLGYHGDPDKLEPIFHGRVVKVTYGENADKISVLAQSFAAELISKVKGKSEEDRDRGYRNTFELLAHMMYEPEVKHFGTCVINRQVWTGEDQSIANNEAMINSQVLIGSWGRLFSWVGTGLLWLVTAGQIGNIRNAFTNTSVDPLAGPQDDNIYCPDEGKLVDHSIRDWDGEINASDYKYHLFNTTIWDVFQEMTFRHPGWIASPVPYGNTARMTMFFGLPTQRYWYRSMKGFGEGSISHYEGLRRAAWDDDGKIRSVTAAKEWLDLVSQRYRPFRNYHVLTSQTDIISNNMIATSHGVFNAVSVQYWDDDLPDTADEKPDPDDVITVKANTDLEDENIREAYLSWVNCRGKILAKRYGLSALSKYTREIYKGSILILGNPRCKPYDLCYIADTYNDICGPIEVEEVVHTFSHQTGFITEIVPDAFVIANDMGSWWTYFTHKYFVGKKFERYIGTGPSIIPNTPSEAEVELQGELFRDWTNDQILNGTAAAQGSADSSPLARAVPIVAGIMGGASIGIPALRVPTAISIGTWMLGDYLYYSWMKDQHAFWLCPLIKQGSPWTVGINWTSNNSFVKTLNVAFGRLRKWWDDSETGIAEWNWNASHYRHAVWERLDGNVSGLTRLVQNARIFTGNIPGMDLD